MDTDTDPRRYELADFEPSDGHLHDCPAILVDRARGGRCDCAALLFCVAQDEAMARARADALCEAWEQEIAFNDGRAPNRPDVDALRAAWKNGGLVPSVDSSPTSTAAALVETLPPVGHDG